MKMYLRKAMQNVATYVELALSAFLTIVIVVLIVKLIGESFFHLNGEGPELSYYLESAMTLAIGIELPIHRELLLKYYFLQPQDR